MTSEMQRLADILQRAQLARSESIPDEPPPPVCPICNGAVYQRYDVPVDDPRFGELVECECTQQKLADQRQRLLLQRSQLADLQHFTFERWMEKYRGGTPPKQSPDAAYRAARQYADTLEINERPWLFLYGTKGTGKTHIAAAIGNLRIHRGQPAIFMVVPDLLDHLRATFSPSSEITYDDLFESLRNTPLLILDDLGTQTASPWAQEKLYQLINHRYNRRLPTVITMNMEGGDIDPRLWSRINDIHLATRYEIREPDKRTAEEQPGRAAQQRRLRTREQHRI
jgi:DNA replication protein DnaC